MSGAPNEPRPVLIAPAMTGKPTSSMAAEGYMPYTCVTCARRKVKCDKALPTCSTCRRSSSTCQYQAPEPRRRRRKPVHDILERLDRYEQLLTQNGILPAQPTAKSPSEKSDTATTATSEASFTQPGVGLVAPEERLGTLHTSGQKTRYINGVVWRSLNDEDMHPSSDEDEDEDFNNRDIATPGRDYKNPITNTLFGAAGGAISLLDLHPTYEMATQLWKLYVVNVDPVCKVLHIPSTEKLLLRTASNPSSATRSFEAILFAVYHFALHSITDDECISLFAQPRAPLVNTYRDAALQALSNAQFLKTTDLAVLQAYILYLLSTRTYYDPHTFWILTGISARLGQRLGLHRYAVERGLNPFDIQMRRRVFYQILPLDGIAAQSTGTAIAIPSDSWDVPKALNLNDSDIWPGMDHTPIPREGATDMMFCLARAELATFLQKAAPRSSDWTRLWEVGDWRENGKMLKDIEELIEIRYLRYCDISILMHCLTMIMARISNRMGQFRTLLPLAKKETASHKERDLQWTNANKCLDGDAAAYENPLLKRFHWHFRAFFQWDSMIWILYELRRDPIRYNDGQIWGKIELVYFNHPDILSMRRALHVAVGRLTIRAWEACRKAQQEAQPDKALGPEPTFLHAIRATLHRRDSRHRPNSTPSTTTSIDPIHDSDPNFNTQSTGTPASMTDVQLQNPEQAPFLNFNPDFIGMEPFNVDPTDWMSWEQLIGNASTFNTESSVMF